MQISDPQYLCRDAVVVTQGESIMRTRILNATMLATAVFSGLTFAQIPKTEEDHSAHHPSAGAPAASTTVPVTSAAPVTETSNQQLKTMQEMHKKMQVAKDPAGRNKLMSEHMKLMQSGMTMMGQMRGDPSVCTPNMNEMMKMHMQMALRMDLMEQMMQMMVDREAARSGQ